MKNSYLNFILFNIMHQGGKKTSRKCYFSACARSRLRGCLMYTRRYLGRLFLGHKLQKSIMFPFPLACKSARKQQQQHQRRFARHKYSRQSYPRQRRTLSKRKDGTDTTARLLPSSLISVWRTNLFCVSLSKAA